MGHITLKTDPSKPDKSLLVNTEPNPVCKTIQTSEKARCFMSFYYERVCEQLCLFHNMKQITDYFVTKNIKLVHDCAHCLFEEDMSKFRRKCIKSSKWAFFKAKNSV